MIFALSENAWEEDDRSDSGRKTKSLGGQSKRYAALHQKQKGSILDSGESHDGSSENTRSALGKFVAGGTSECLAYPPQ